ncbi:MAG: metallophosphoesterase, partial [Pseudonocardiaceae bacterium]
MNRLGRATLGTAALTVAGVAYAAGVEVRRWTLRRATLPVLPVGAAPLRILHISDLHMTPN